MGSGFAETQFLLGSVLPGGWVFSNLWVQVLQKHNFSVLPGGWVFSNLWIQVLQKHNFQCLTRWMGVQ
ncbi:hypothetical protein GBAR_LOCUS31461 [Geodia barretti]|uniref:Uncharacterized protein n=1 Tax=Geodia barretti TaxID=519541 RepID=A0AA35XHL3_GEOBA|nr:hypothetical protein GBAR_LOCUS31461 [Geodia barretti]